MPRKIGQAKLTDKELFAKAEEARELEIRIANLSKSLLKKKKTILDEFERRGTKSIEHGDRTLTYVQASNVVYHWDQLLAKLSPKRRKLVMKEVPDRGLLLAAIQAGQIKAALVDEHSEVKESAPYYRYT